jgi:hypothetical protein
MNEPGHDPTRIRLRLLAAVVALGAGVAALVVAILLVQGALA